MTTSSAPRVSVPRMHNDLRAIMDARHIDPATLSVRLRAAGCDVSFHTVVAWYYGYRTPGPDNAAAIALELGVSVDEVAA